jgi:hypothetical protein
MGYPRGMLLSLALTLLQSPVALAESPMDFRLYPRDLATDAAAIAVAGDWAAPDAGAVLRLEVSGSDGWSGVAEVEALPLVQAEAQPFRLAVAAPAGLVDYDVLLVLRHAGVDEVVASWERVAVGDVYLIHGQSNAVASDYYDEDLANARDQSPWIRSYGSASRTPAEVLADTTWHLADAETDGGPGSVGIWALHLSRRIVEKQGVPIGLLNGAVGGTTVAQHQRNDADPDDLNTIYGRLLHRANAAGVASAARALFWYQGESDGAGAQGWLDGFGDLMADWDVDFPGIEHLWIIQVRRGCGSPSLELRDHQRTLAHGDATIHTATANGLPGHDGCHFRDKGYLQLALDLGPVVAHHLYGRPLVPDASSPDVLAASWDGAAQDAFFLDFRNVTAPLLVPDASSYNTLTVDDGTQVVGVTAVGNRLRVELAGPSTAATVSFQGHAYNRADWIVNARGLAMMGFFELPIQ